MFTSDDHMRTSSASSAGGMTIEAGGPREEEVQVESIVENQHL
jgi:hypothetical protein